MRVTVEERINGTLRKAARMIPDHITPQEIAQYERTISERTYLSAQLSKRANEVLTAEGDWYAIRSNPNCERKAVDSLSRGGYRPFFPVERYFIKSKEKREAREKALFCRYVFVFVDRGQSFFAIRRCDGVESIVNINGTPRIIHDDIIGTLMAQEEEGIFDYTKPKPKLQPGTLVRIDRGVFRGFTAEVMRASGDERVEVLLKAIGRISLREDDVVAA